MRNPEKSATIWTIPLAILLAAALVIAADPDGLASHLRGIEYDAYQRWQPRPYEDTVAKSNYAVRVLDVDHASLARFGPWPWSRVVLAKLTRELTAAGASLIVYDFPLDMPDPNSPEHLAGLAGGADPPSSPNVPSPDALFAAELGSTRAVTGFVLGEAGQPPDLKSKIVGIGAADVFAGVPSFKDAAAALPIFESRSAGIGALNLETDADGHLRTLPVVFRLKELPVPSLEAEVMRLLSGKPHITVRAAQGGGWIGWGSPIVGAEAGSLEIPLRHDGALTLYYSDPTVARLVSAADLDAGRVESARLKNAIVYIAPPGTMVLTPTGWRNEGEARAEAMENILLGNPLKDASNVIAELIFLAVAGAGLVVLFARAGVMWAGVLALVAIVGAQAFAWFLFVNAHLLLDATNPSIALAVAFTGGFATRAMQITRRRAELERSFADALPEAALQQIARSPSLLRLEGQSRTITYLSCGIRGYAKVLNSFATDPAGFTHLSSMVMSPLLDAATAGGGTIAYFSGDRFAAFWNAPLEDPDHAIHACEAANRMSLALATATERLSQERRSDGTPFDAVEIGIGISTGAAIAGSFATGRNAYSVSGDCTFIAERICALSGQYGPAIIVSEETRKVADRSFAFLEVDYIATGTDDQPVKLYAMLGSPLVRASPKFKALSTFHDHIFESIRNQQWRTARALIDQCRKLSGASPKLYDLHLSRISWYETHPPGADWDGAFRPVLR